MGDVAGVAPRGGVAGTQSGDGAQIGGSGYLERPDGPAECVGELTDGPVSCTAAPEVTALVEDVTAGWDMAAIWEVGPDGLPRLRDAPDDPDPPRQ